MFAWIGKAALWLSTLWIRLRDKILTRLLGLAFGRLGRASTLAWPIRLQGVGGIEIGEGVYIGANSWLQTMPGPHCQRPRISIGDGVSASGSLVLSAVREIVIEAGVLFARNVYVSDHAHRFEEAGRPIQEQGVDKVAPVRIGEGAWLGQNVVVCPGVRIGAGAVVGANSVVNSDIPDRSVAVGAPARVVRRI